MKESKTFRGKRYSQPKAASSIIDSAFRAFGVKKKLAQYEAFPLWPEVVGKEVALVSYPEKIVRGKVMVVRVIDSAWGQELSLRKPTILDKIHNLGIGSTIEDIRFVIGSPEHFKNDNDNT